MSVIATRSAIDHLSEIVGEGSVVSVIEAMNHLGWTVLGPGQELPLVQWGRKPSNQGAQQP